MDAYHHGSIGIRLSDPEVNRGMVVQGTLAAGIGSRSSSLVSWSQEKTLPLDLHDFNIPWEGTSKILTLMA